MNNIISNTKKMMAGCTFLLFAFIQPVVAQNADVKQNFNKSLNSYYVLKNALAADQSAEAPALAATLLKTVKEMPNSGFASDKQQKLWTLESGKIQAQASQLIQSNDLKVQRKSFEGISTAFVTLTQELKINTAPVFVQYCPMAKSTWLNEVKEIQNPYYGSAMKDCGSVKELIGKR